MSVKIPDYDRELDRRFIVGESSYTIVHDESYPTFSYSYLNIGKIPEYCFYHDDFLQEDYKNYFKTVRTFSNMTLGDIIRDKHKYKFSLNYSPSGDDLEHILSIAGVSNLDKEEIPPVGHFHLNFEPKEAGIKRRVIHFFLGNNCVFHIMLYDPNHQVHQTDH
jgi:hypothetical protein